AAEGQVAGDADHGRRHARLPQPRHGRAHRRAARSERAEGPRRADVRAGAVSCRRGDVSRRYNLERRVRAGPSRSSQRHLRVSPGVRRAGSRGRPSPPLSDRGSSMSKKTKLSVFAVFLVALAGVATLTAMRSGTKAVNVRIEPVQKRDLIASVTASGNVTPHTKVD